MLSSVELPVSWPAVGRAMHRIELVPGAAPSLSRGTGGPRN